LSLYTTERDVTDLFTRYGPVDKVQMVYDYHTGKSRGFAFVYMKHLDDAVEVFNG
jgi:transformer-2 protein